MPSLELRVKVLLAVRRVDELMETRAVDLVRREVLHGHCVPAKLQVFELEANSLALKESLLNTR